MLIGILSGIIANIIFYLLGVIFFIKPFGKHKKIYAKIKHLQRNYKDVFNENFHDSYIIGIIEKQNKEINEIIDNIYAIVDTNPIFSFFFNYKKVLFWMNFLFEYNRNPIMLNKNKIFEDDYKIDLRNLFFKILFYMNVQYKFLLLIIFIGLLTIFLFNSKLV